jgi:tyrosyl-tRNA synthetase
MRIVEELRERGLLAQITHEEEFLAQAKMEPLTAYVGYDPTAASLTAGHLVPTMVLARWQRQGGRAIVVMGSGTAMIGDPSGRTEMRKMLTLEEIDHNKKCMKLQLEKFLDLSDPKKGLIVDNGDWLRSLNYLEFLLDIGPHFSVNRMLTTESVRQRLEKGLSFLEFNYSLLQSYDFLHLARHESCAVQIGGDDQWSNMLGGMELIRRLLHKPAYCLTIPLLLTSSGQKMGKTEKGALWLDPERTPPFEFFQYWRNVEDLQAVDLLKKMTFMTLSEISPYEKLSGADLNQAKERLAWELTKLVHGQAAADEAKDTAKSLFSGDASSLAAAPLFQISRATISEGISITDLLTQTGIFPSKAEVRRLIAQNGLQIEDQKISDPNLSLSLKNWPASGELLIKRGKKHYYRIAFS